MGTFEGHVVPGVFFIIYGLWWLVGTLFVHFWSRNVSSTSGKSNRKACRREHEINKRSYVPVFCCPRLPLESIIKIILPLMGMFVELFLDKIPDPEHEGQMKVIVKSFIVFGGDELPIAKWQHATMYACFLLSGVVDLLSLVIRLPKKTPQLFLSIAFWIEGLLFYFHVGGRELLDVRVHYILTMAIFAGAIAALGRMYSGTHFAINAVLTFSLLYQGVWFVQAATIMYGSNSAAWDWTNHHHAMLVALIASWHFILVAFFMLSVWTSAHLVLKCRKRAGKKLPGAKSLSRKLKIRPNVNSDEDEEDEEAKIGLMASTRKEYQEGEDLEGEVPKLVSHGNEDLNDGV